MKHLHELSPEQKTRLLAELDGFNCWYQKQTCTYGVSRGTHHVTSCYESSVLASLPPYLTSYDAIIPLVQKLPSYEQQVIAEKIYKQGWLSPSQLCDAVLVATGKAEV